MSFLKNKTNQLKIITLLLFITVSSIFCFPAFQGKVLYQHDIKQVKGASSEIYKYRDSGKQILWTNALFSGMPTTLISVLYEGEYSRYVSKIFRGMPHPTGYIFALMLGFYILLLSLQVDLRLAMIGGILYGLTSFFLVYISAGHNTKVEALAYIPGIFAGFIWLYRHRKIYLGAAVLALFFALEVQARHPQMLYYMLFVLLIYVVYELIEYIRTKEIIMYLKLSLVALICLLVASASSYSYLRNTAAYGEKSIRGKSELSIKEDNTTSNGLNKDYITQWSYGISESISLLIPNFKGGDSKPLGKMGVDLSKLKNKDGISKHRQYWGDQPLLSGPVYAGAFILFLAIVGIILIKNRIKYVFISATVLTITLSWGKNAPVLTDFFIDYFPFYTKFRAVASMMVIPLLLIPVLGILCLDKFIKEDIWENKTTFFGKSVDNKKIIWVTFIVFSAFCLIGILLPHFINGFLSIDEDTFLAERLVKSGYTVRQAYAFIDELVDVRISIFRFDAIRTLIVLLTGGLFMWLYASKKIKQQVFIIAIGFLVVADLYTIDKRYMSEKDFVKETKVKRNYGIEITPADAVILNDKDPHFRVLNLIDNPFNESTTSYFHKSIGGYHGAKLKIYQDLIDYQITADMHKINDGIINKKTVPEIFSNTNALNMLNAKYVITTKEHLSQNPNALGNAWFVSKINYVKTAEEEIKKISEIDVANEAIVRETLSSELNGYEFGKDTNAYITLTFYNPDNMIYSSSNTRNGFAVFSEIYYPNWQAYIDGKKQEIIRVNYALRGLKIPSGKHELVLKYEDQLYKASTPISLIGSLLILLGVPVLLFMHFKTKKHLYRKDFKISIR